MKHLLIAAYIFSVFYCYMQLNTLIDRCVEIFKERHPAVPMDEAFGWKGVKLTIELLAVSAIPVVNLILSYLLFTLGESVVSEVVNAVELNHWHEINELERASEELLGSNR